MPPATISRTSISAFPATSRWATTWSPICGSTFTRLYVQDDWRVTPKLTLNLGLRWEFATPIWERDNLWSNFNPATNTLVRATNGSLYDRALVNPDYKDFGPRLGLAYSIDSKTSIRAGYGISYSFFNRPGSAMEGINGPLAIFGTYTTSRFSRAARFPPDSSRRRTPSPRASPPPSTRSLPTTTTSPPIPAGPISSPGYFPSSARSAKDTVLEVAYNGNHSSAAAHHRRLESGGRIRNARATARHICWACRRGVPDPSFGAITWVDPAGDNDYNGLSVRLEHRFSKGLYFLNSFTWCKAIGRFRAGTGRLLQPDRQRIRRTSTTSAAERGPSSYDVKLINVTSVVYELPFGKGRQFGGNMNPVLDAMLGGWELNGINTANTGLPINVYYAPSTANDVTGLATMPSIAARPCLRPNVSGSAAQPEHGAEPADLFRRLHLHDAARTNARSATWAATRSAAPGFEQWDLGDQQELPHHGRHQAAVPQRVLQRPEPHELLAAEPAVQQLGVRHNHHDLSAAADPVRSEADVLMAQVSDNPIPAIPKRRSVPLLLLKLCPLYSKALPVSVFKRCSARLFHRFSTENDKAVICQESTPRHQPTQIRRR